MDKLSDGIFIRRILAAAGIIILILLLWRLLEVILLAFGAALVAILLRAISNPIYKHTRFSQQWSLSIACGLILLVLAISGWLLGATVQNQLSDLGQELPQAWASLRKQIYHLPGGEYLLAQMGNDIEAGKGMIAAIARTILSFGNGLVAFLIVLIGGIYIASQPALYWDGVLKLIPAPARGRIADAMEDCGHALKLWLLGQLASMAIIGILITFGLWMIGMPSVLALGFLAAVGEFVPMIGTTIAVLPALLIALSQSWEMTAWTAIVYIVVQQLEGHLIVPLIQEYTVYLPPALTLLTILAFTLLLGLPGLLLATPLTVAIFVAVKKLYVRDMLGEQTSIPGE